MSEPGCLSSHLGAIRERLRALDHREALRLFDVHDAALLWKSTISLCPHCLMHVPALVFSSAGRVYMQKLCGAHGLSRAVVENDENFYHLSNKDQWGRRYAPETNQIVFPKIDPGEIPWPLPYTPQLHNKSCTVLVEVTNACNLACAVCYSDAKGDRKLSLADFKLQIDRLIEKKGTLDSVQLTGGEAVLHPEFWDMVDFLHNKEEIKKIYLPTNGIAFAKPEVAAKLQPYARKVMVLLQFDGADTEANRALRNANTTLLRTTVIENLARLGIHMQLTMTITKRVNDDEIGWVILQGLEHTHIKVIALQPVTYSGRYDLTQDPLERMTLSDVLKATVSQLQNLAEENDFSPIPCSHPNCGWITLFARRFGMRKNISRHIDLQQVMTQVANRTLLSTGELRNVLGTKKSGAITTAAHWLGKRLIRSSDVFAIAIKPFMDKFNYDQDRISACCHHLLDRQGDPTSFCEYNARLRGADTWDNFPHLTSTTQS